MQFLEFGESALVFYLFTWIPDPKRQFAIASDLHFSILKQFREAGIVIAFPQMDVHLDSPEKS